MNPQDFLGLARTLATDTTEAAWRSAVSRAYYAAFHVARDWFSALGFTVPHGDQAHRYLTLRLSNCGDPKVEGAGRELDTLRRDRNRADYDLHLPVRAIAAHASIQMAEQIIQVRQAADVEPTRTQVTDAMKTYERDVLKIVSWHP